MLHSGMVLAAPQSGSGKTTITCALLAAMKKQKTCSSCVQKHQDYIDPMFHRQVIGVPSRNLDTFFSGADQIRELYGYDRESFSYSVIEGAMGLYDGLGGTQKKRAPPIIWHRPWICRLCLCWMPVGWGARWWHFWQGYYSMTGITGSLV